MFRCPHCRREMSDDAFVQHSCPKLDSLKQQLANFCAEKIASPIAGERMHSTQRFPRDTIAVNRSWRKQ